MFLSDNFNTYSISFEENPESQKPSKYQAEELIKISLLFFSSECSDFPLTYGIKGWPEYHYQKEFKGDIWLPATNTKLGCLTVVFGDKEHEFKLSLFIYPAFRRKGFGFRISDFLLSNLSATRQLKEIKIQASYQNNMAVNLLLKLGFVPVVNYHNNDVSITFVHVKYQLEKRRSIISFLKDRILVTSYDSVSCPIFCASPDNYKNPT